jgi:hypothetical protein
MSIVFFAGCNESVSSCLIMLTQEEATALGSRLDELPCMDPETGDGLFTWVFQREPPERTARYESHMRTCEHCRIALEVYRYKRDVAERLGGDAQES